MCTTPFGDVQLRRTLPDRTGTLQAWDGADLLLLDHVAQLSADQSGRPPAIGDTFRPPLPLSSSVRVLVVGDTFGALSIGLEMAGLSVVSWCDSRSAQHAIEANRREAALDGPVAYVSDADALASVGPFDLIVWHVDRITDLVSDVLAAIAPVTHASTVVLGGGMDKNLPPRTAEILRTAGVVTTHPGRRKAHVFELRASGGATSLHAVEPPTPTITTEPALDLVVAGAPGVFSADRLDLGTRLLAEQISTRLPALRLGSGGSADAPAEPVIVDLGCGTGVLGITALRARPDARVFFLDDSARAIACAKANVESNLGADGLARSVFIHSDVYDDANHAADAAGLPETVDLVLCNPPFHHAGAVTDEVAWQMFTGTRDRLRRGGELWVVANRHLGYHAALGRAFAAVRALRSHPKYVLLAASGSEPTTARARSSRDRDAVGRNSRQT